MVMNVRAARVMTYVTAIMISGVVMISAQKSNQNLARLVSISGQLVTKPNTSAEGYTTSTTVRTITTRATYLSR